MADPNKTSSGYKSKPAPPPWANSAKNRVRRHTATTQPPPKPTGSNRSNRYAPTKKKRNPPPKPTPTQSTTSPAHKPKSYLYKATPLVLNTPTSDENTTTKSQSINSTNTNVNANTNANAPPHLKFKRASLQHTALSKVMMNQNKINTKNMIKSQSYSTNTRSKSPVPPAPPAKVNRWEHHPHAKLYEMGGDEEIKSNNNNNKPPPPPAPGKQMRHAQVAMADNVNRKYMKNIAGFEDETLNNIDKCNIEALLGCMHEGSECLKHFQNALTTFAKQQQTQCANFLKLFKKSKSRYAKLDAMPNFFYAISLVHTLLEETVKQSAEFAKFIQISCLPMISELETQCDQKYKEIYSITKSQDKKLSDLRSDVEKQRKTSKQSAQKVVISRQKNEVYKQNEKLKQQQQYAPKKHNILSNMSDMIAAGKTSYSASSINDAYVMAKEQEKKFKLSVAEYNKLRMDFINKRNDGKHEIINMEHFRVDSMLTVFQKIVAQQRKQSEQDHNKVYQLQNDVVTHVDSMKAKTVLSKFIHLSVETHGEWKAPEAMESTLDVEYRDMFHSIEDAMNITLEINKEAKIPLIVPLLCEKIKDLNGFKTEGIFRKSPNKSNMLRIKKRLQVKNFQLYEDNPHVYCALLKEWLRGLDDLLIPKRYYDYCVSMAKENKLDAKQFEVFFSQLPSVNRECLKYLIKFLRELLKPQYKQYTKMGLENIAIVFGPTLLMPPGELEPLVALQNAKSEKQFVSNLIQNS